MGSLNILPVTIIKSLFTFLGQFWSFSTKICSLEKICLPTCLGPESIYVCVSNNGYPSIIKITEKDLELLSRATTRKARNTILCWLARGPKADTVLAKLPDRYPCPLLIIILLSIFDSCPGSWPKIAGNFGIFVFHRPQDC